MFEIFKKFIFQRGLTTEPFYLTSQAVAVVRKMPYNIPPHPDTMEPVAAEVSEIKVLKVQL